MNSPGASSSAESNDDSPTGTPDRATPAVPIPIPAVPIPQLPPLPPFLIIFQILWSAFPGMPIFENFFIPHRQVLIEMMTNGTPYEEINRYFVSAFLDWIFAFCRLNLMYLMLNCLRNNLNQANLVVDPFAENRRRMLAEEERMRRIESKNLRRRIVDSPFEDNNWRKDAQPSVTRRFFEIRDVLVVNKKIGDLFNPPMIQGRYLPGQETDCVYCGIGGDGLVGCEVSNICSKWHVSCAKKYHADCFLFQYGCRPECQDAMLCPLHFCAACNNDLRRQSAGYDKSDEQRREHFVECCKCLRAFHKKCVPAGCRKVRVALNDGTEQEMIVCPSHSTFNGAPVEHIGICYNKDCSSKAPLIDCNFCVQSFHDACNRVESIDGFPMDKKTCERCARNATIRIGLPVVKRQNGRLCLGLTANWAEHPDQELVIGDELGKVAVRWLKNVEEVTVEGVRDLAQLMNPYLKFLAREEIAVWDLAKNTFDVRNVLPKVLKKVRHEIKISKTLSHDDFDGLFATWHRGSCECRGTHRCRNDVCMYFADRLECPPDCGDGCQNRWLSERPRPTSVTVRSTNDRGFGVFAIEDIKSGEFIAEYLGERIDNEEKNNRLRIVSVSGDLEQNRYMMTAHHGVTIDAAAYGNIARYINHACDANAVAEKKSTFVKLKKRGSLYAPRIVIVATKDIREGEEVTIVYNMSNVDGSLPPCACGTASCTGLMGSSKVAPPAQKPPTGRRPGRPKKHRSPSSNGNNNAKRPCP